MRTLTTKLRLQDSVQFRFDISEVDAASAHGKRELFRASKVLVLPSSVEGFGIVVLEANACGVPVVASSGVPEGAVRDGYNGLRYPFGEINALSQRIIAILTDDKLYGRLSANSTAFARKFDWRTVSSQYAAIVERAATNNSGP